MQALDISQPVQHALQNGRAVVALESTVITHGLPKPDNLELAQAMQDDIRKKGAEPATICVMDGVIKVGLSDNELAALADRGDVLKASTRDLAFALANKHWASTTVAATMVCAQLAGIAVFATGGIGGVHRGAEQSFDISGDLVELARTPVHVVCAGCKSILDIDKTLEYLETQSVPVVSYQQDSFPAFYSAESPWQSPHRMDTVTALANAIRVHQALAQTSGVLIANPIPAEHEIPFQQIEVVIQQAIATASQERVRGKAVTPFILKQMAEIGGQQVVDANIALLRNNARLAAMLAVALAES